MKRSRNFLRVTYGPSGWTWLWIYGNSVSMVLGTIGSILIMVGMTTTVIAMAWLGSPCSRGQQVDTLKISGPYRASRNPRILGGALVIVSIFLLQPSWYALGWVILCATMLHMMVLTEGEHLRERFGVEYERYMDQAPRYLGIPKKGRAY